MALRTASDAEAPSLSRRLIDVNWGFLLLLTAVAAVGAAMLYSVADGDFNYWARAHINRYGMGMALLLIVALSSLRFWRAAAYPLYALTLALLALVLVDGVGEAGKGAQRWIDLGVIRLQPSELMKVVLFLTLARYYQGLKVHEVSRLRALVPALLLIAAPMGLVHEQPDLGTEILIGAIGAAVMFAAGVHWLFFAGGAVLAVGGAFAIYPFLRPYQQRRIEVFFNPEADPLNAGYHIMQSKIAFGSGGVVGRGFLQGPQSHLNFLPEKHTDFIFTAFAEEFGLVGGLALLTLYAMLTLYGLFLALQIRHQFGRLLALGAVVNLFLYVFINMAMVMGLAPVVGVPLPFVSYGGTSMLSLMFGFGLMICAYVHRNTDLGQSGRGT